MSLPDSRSLLLRAIGRRFLSHTIKRTLFRRIAVASVLASALVSLQSAAAARTLPEYTAAEAKKHIGETVRVTDTVGCALSNRHGGYNLGLGDCDAHPPFWVVTHGDISGPKLDVPQLKGRIITVTGKIDNESGVPRIFVKSTSQIASGSRGKSRGRVRRRKNLARDTDVARPRRSHAAAPLRKRQRA